MQLFELSLIIAIFLALMYRIMPKERAPVWSQYFPVLALFLMALHLYLEGYLWTMTLVYVITGYLFITAVYRFARGPRKHDQTGHRANKALTILKIVSVLILFAIALLPVIFFPVLKLPDPTGPYAIGTRYSVFIDEDRPDPFTGDPGDFRSVSIQAWYPAKVNGKSPFQPYMSQEATRCWAQTWGLKPSFVLGHFSSVKTHAIQDAGVSVEGKPYPVILFSSSGIMSYNTALLEELASHGYVVFNIGHPHWFPYYFDGNGGIRCTGIDDEYYDRLWEEENLEEVNEIKEKLTVAKRPEEKAELQRLLNENMPLEVHDIRLWAEDLDFVLGEVEKLNNEDPSFLNMLNLSHVGVIGFSKGGVSAAQFCISDTRCKAGINLGGFMFGDATEKNIRQPFMFMENIEPWCVDCLPICDHIYSKVENRAYMLQIEDATHFNFTDLSLGGPFLKLIGLIGSIDGNRFIKIQNEYVLAFFDKYLYGKVSPLLDSEPSHYTEVKFKSRDQNPLQFQ